MKPIEDPSDERARSGLSEACTVARGQLPAFLAGDLPRSNQRSLRSHLVGCTPCRGRFEEAIGFAARLHSGTRRTGEEAARAERRRAQRARALAGALRIPGGERGARLRLLLLPAFAIFLFTQVARGPRAAEHARVEVIEGPVQVGERELLTCEGPVGMLSGELCATGEAGRARLAVAGSTIELSPQSWLWLESALHARLRLGGGQVIARGPSTVTCSLGVVEIEDGAARVRLLPRELEVETLEGGVLVADSRGQRVVLPGSTLKLRSP